MPDREKVKAELNEIVEQCRGMDYIGFSTITEHCQNILALLKDDETRIQYLKDHIAMCKEEVERLHKEQEVVRCKDCIYGEHEKNEGTGTEWIYCAHHRENRPNEWFCASGSPTIKQEGRKME